MRLRVADDQQVAGIFSGPWAAASPVPLRLRHPAAPYRMKRRNNSRAVFRYPLEFKERAVVLSNLPGLRVHEVARMLMIHPQLLVAWRGEARVGPIKGAPPSRRSAGSAPVKKARSERAAQEALRADDALRRLLVATPLLQDLSAMRNGAFASPRDVIATLRNLAGHPPSQYDASDISLQAGLVSIHFGTRDNGHAETLR